MEKVKGSILIDFVKTIKADKSGVYDQYLTDADREVMSERILPSGWYPYRTFRNCFNATVNVLAGNDLEAVRQWGKLYGESIITGVYKSIIKEGKPMESLRKYGTYVRNVFDGGKMEIDTVSDQEAVVRISEFDPDFPPLYYMIMGWIERSIELCGAANIKVELIAKSWEGAPETAIRFSWNI